MLKNYKAWYEDNYHLLTGNGLWLRGGEPNTVSPDRLTDQSLTVLISRLSTSWDVSDSYTHKLLYEMLTAIDGVYADMSFLPPPRDAHLMTGQDIPWLLGTSSKMAGAQFDVIAFSNSIVQELINVPILLQKSGIPLSKKERCAAGDFPIVILGGANALFTSALLGDDPVVDGIFVGESRYSICTLFEIVRDCKKQGCTKAQTLTALEAVDGFVQPDKSKTTRKFTSMELEPGNLPCTPPLMYIADQPGRAQIPISEGCPCFCSFCAESWSRKPYREFSPEAVKKSALSLKASLGAGAVELYSFNFSMHSKFYTVLQDMVSIFSSVKVTSQRFDHIADDPPLLRFLHATGKSTFTCGLEGISGRLRRYLHKSLDESKLRSSLSLLLRSPVRELKLFLIATGKENEDDYNEFRDFLTRLVELMHVAGRKPRVIFSMTPLVRFPFTPLESENAPEPSVYHEIIHQVERLVKCRGMEFRISADLNDYLLSQILVRAADDAVLSACIEACHSTGFVYYREISDLFIKVLTEILQEKRHSIKWLLRGWNQENRNALPVITEVDRAFLENSQKLAMSFEDKGHCLGTFTDEALCKGCGACQTADARNNVTAKRERETPSLEKFRREIKESASRVYQCECMVCIDHQKRGIPRDVIGALIARAFMQAEPALVNHYQKYCGSYAEQMFGSSWITGDDIIRLQFSSHSEAMIRNNETLIEKVNTFLAGWCVVSGYAPSERSFTRILHFQASFRADPSMYCSVNQLKHMRLKNPDGSYRFQFTPQALKKQHIHELQTSHDNDLYTVVVQAGPKFDFRQFIDQSFVYPSPQCKARVAVALTLKSSVG